MKKLLLLLILIICIYAESTNDESSINSKNIISDTVNMLKNKDPKSEYLFGVELTTSIVKDEIYPINHSRVTYLTNILNNLILSSEMPYIFDGYKIILVKNDTFNAFALPGGIIIIHDGLFKHLENEDQIASIISHEIGHIQERHSIETNKGTILNDLAKVSALIAVSKKVENGLIQNLTFNITSKMTNSIEQGYNVDMEAEADQIGITIMNNAGYDPTEFLNVLNKLKNITNTYGGANYPENRYERLEKIVKTLKFDNSNKQLRLARYEKFK